MANRNKRVGSEWEGRVLQYLRDNNFDVELLRTTGAEDEGDLVVKVGQPLIIQAKAEKGYNLAYLKDAHEQAGHYAKHRGLDYVPDAVLVLKRRNHPISRAYVVQEFEQWVEGLK